MLQSSVVTILLLLFATSNGLYRLPLKRYQRSVQSLANQDGTKIPVRFDDGYGVVAEIQVGNQSDVFYVQLDTGSSGLIIPSVKCESCETLTQYECVKESNFTVGVWFSGVKGTGRFCVDNITIGGLTVQNQQFLVMEDIQIQPEGVDGVLGMGFSGFFVGQQNISDYPYVLMRIIYRPETVLKNMVLQELVPLNVFSVRYPGEENEDGEVIFGGIDTSLYTGNLSYADVIPEQTDWKVNLEGFQFGSHNLATCNAVSPCSALIGTATMNIWIPFSHGIALMEILSHDAPSLIVKSFETGAGGTGFKMWVKSRDVPILKPINIYIAGEMFTIEPSAYLTKSVGDLYYLKLMVTNLPFWALGEPFLRSVYTVFDVQNMRIGFAPAV